jgi:tetratricopeptide (TPR) repeat protein
VANRSLGERWHKWRRRRPSRLRTAGVAMLLAGAAVVLLAGAWSNLRDRRQQAELALRDGQRQLGGKDFDEAVNSFERGVALADSLPFAGGLRRQTREQLAAARRLHLGRQLHQLADEVRLLYGADRIPPGRMKRLASRCDEFWNKRRAIMDALGAAQDPHLTADLQDVAIFAAGLKARLPSASDPAGGRREALRLLDEAEATFGPSVVLVHERQTYDPRAAPATAPATAPAARTGWEHYALGRSLLGAGDVSGAAAQFTAALRLDPAGRWPNFYYGLCAYRLGRHEDAVAAFSVCIGAAPDAAGCYYNRALASARLGHADRALADYDRALELDPTHAAAALNRGMLHFQAGSMDRARADLHRALDNGADAATVHYDLALVHSADNDRAAALHHVAQALHADAGHEQARHLREALRRQSTTPGAGD